MRLAAMLGGAALALSSPVRAQDPAPPPAAPVEPLNPATEVALQALLAAPLAPPPPDAFGLPAVEIDPAVTDRRWADLRARPNNAPSGPWGELAARLKGQPVAGMAETVNHFVNARVALATDTDIYGADDYWANLDETVAAGRGDCEDLAIAKMQLLQAAGVSPGDLYLLLVRDLGRNIDHAVLLVRDGARLLVLDSAAERVIPTPQVARYRPIMAFSGETRWLYRPDLVDSADDEGALSGAR